MSISVHPLLVQWLTSLAAVFVIVDPFAATPTFLAITADCDRLRRERTARRAALTCFALLTIFGITGKYIFRIFGITMPAFKCAGGLLLLLVALDTAVIAYLVLASADRVEAVLGDTGIRVLTRLMGLMLTAIAFQFFVSALVDMHLIAPVPLP
ncbi:MAG TPA: MarC family protein [Edaphobacter sp.]|nr:MarC family protein [Edaphobacter sp.]